MFKSIALAAVLSINIFYLNSSEAPKLTRSASQTFYLNGIAVTAYKAAREVGKPLAIRSHRDLHTIDLEDGTTHRLTPSEYLAIKENQEFMLLAARYKTAPGTYAPFTKVDIDYMKKLEDKLRADEAVAQKELVVKLKEKRIAIDAAIKASGGKCTVS